MLKKIISGILSASILTMLYTANVSAYSYNVNINGGDLSESEMVESEKTLYLKAGESMLIPNSCDPSKISIDDDSVAVLTHNFYYENGQYYNVVGLKEGTATVTMTPFLTQDVEIYTIKVEGEFPDNLKLSKSEISISLDDTKKLNVLNIINPDNDSWKEPGSESRSIYNEAAEWKTDDENILTVENGHIYPKSAGTAKVTALLNGKTYECTVTVTGKSDMSYMTGDITLDGKITLRDVIVAAEALIGKNELDDVQKAAADLNSNGRIDLADVIGIAKLLFSQIA